MLKKPEGLGNVVKSVVQTTRTTIGTIEDLQSDLTPPIVKTVAREVVETTTEVVLETKDIIEDIIPLGKGSSELIKLISVLLPPDAPFAALKEFAEIAYAEYNPGSLNKLSFEDVLLAAYLFSWAQFRSQENLGIFKPGIEVREKLAEFLYWLPFATVAYGRNFAIDEISITSPSDLAWIAKETGVSDAKLLRYLNISKDNKVLPHYVLVNDEKKCVVVGIRGTLPISSSESVMTDLRGRYKEFELPKLFPGRKFQAHRGILEKAKNMSIDPALVSSVKEGLVSNPEYGLVIVGHSLGGGASALLGVLWSKLNASGKFITNEDSGVEGREIQCITFAAAAPYNLELTTKTEQLVSNLVNQNDCVSSLSYGALEDLNSVAEKLKSDRRLNAEIFGKIATDGSSREHAKWVLQELRKITRAANNLKLPPPGTTYGVNTDPKTEETWAGVYNDVKERFREVQFLPGCILDHMIASYAATLNRKPGPLMMM